MTAKENSFGLAGRVCVVTGGGSGIGRGIATAFAKEGASVVVLDVNEANAQETAQRVTKAGARGLALACDVSDQNSVENACIAVTRELGDAHVLVNNAAILKPGGLDTLSLADWNALISVNLTGYFICSQVFGRAMRANGDGALVHISSAVADVVNPLSGAYSVAKAGVTALSKLLALEWGPTGVRSNAIYPGMIMTPLTEDRYAQPGVTEWRKSLVPIGKIGRPDDIAEAALFLASNRASYINGSVITVDGGMSQNLMSLVRRVPK